MPRFNARQLKGKEKEKKGRFVVTPPTAVISKSVFLLFTINEQK